MNSSTSRFYLRHKVTGLFLRVRLGGVCYWSAFTGGNGYNGAAEGFENKAEAESALAALSLSPLEIVEL